MARVSTTTTQSESTLPEPRKAFVVHSRYFRALTLIAGFDNQSTEEQALRKIANDLAPQLGVAGRQVERLDRIRSALINAWSTELLLCLSSELRAGDEFVRVTNNWAAVQAYYAAFHAARALSLSLGLPPSRTHPTTLKHYVALWPHSKIRIYPWTIGVGSKNDPLIVPGSKVINRSLNPLTTVCAQFNCWDFAVKAIETTRKEALPGALDDERDRKMAKFKKDVRAGLVRAGKATGRKNLTQSERDEVERSLRPYSFLDYLYRLRMRSHYEDATMFLDGPVSSDESLRVQTCMRQLLASTLLVHEMRLLKIVGKKTMSKWMDEWLATNMPKDRSIGLAARRTILN